MLELVGKYHPQKWNILVAKAGTPAEGLFGEWAPSIPLSEDEQEICSRMLEAGGDLVLWVPGDRDVQNWIERGQIIHSENLVCKPGLPNDCRANSARYWQKHNARCSIVTGYGLSADGMWRQHTFLTQADETVIETTVPRKLYFEYRLEPAEAWQFVDGNP
jgi:hypothetical protein